jgi:ribosomal-protein-alanine N-acetyltransferase
MQPPAARVSIRLAGPADGPALIRAHLASRDFHQGWAEPFTDRAGFVRWLEPIEAGRKLSFLVEADGRLTGVVSLGDIIRGSFQCAYLGYYAMAGMAGGGRMTEAVRQVVAHAFGPLGLHRLEANIQPNNAPSLALIARLGFRREGFSPRYLRIAGVWRDHERWARLADDRALGG